MFKGVYNKSMEHHNHNHDHGHDHHNHDASDILKPKWTDWLPLMVVIGFIVASTITVATLTAFTLYNLLTFSMGFFFLYFAMFKLINLPGFVEGYHEYDIIAMRQKSWGYVYPFIELALGVLYLAAVNDIWLHVFTIILTAINCTGIIIKLAKKEKFYCACLGTVLKVPLTKVSLVEYAAMGVMAIAMIFI